MPDHFHALVRGMETTSDLLVFLKRLKQETAYEFQRRFGHTLWQMRFYDHILRPKDSPDRVAAYIWMNPVRQGLCGDPKEYAYSGSFVSDWKGAAQPDEPWAPLWKRKLPATKT